MNFASCCVNPSFDCQILCKPRGKPRKGRRRVIDGSSLRMFKKAYGRVCAKVVWEQRRPKPSLDDGPSICLGGHAKTDGTEHNEAHKGDAEITGMRRNGLTMARLVHCPSARPFLSPNNPRSTPALSARRKSKQRCAKLTRITRMTIAR